MITERLTQRRSRFLRYAKSKYGNFNAWTNDGEILVKTEGVIRNMTSEFYDCEQDILNYLIQPVQITFVTIGSFVYICVTTNVP